MSANANVVTKTIYDLTSPPTAQDRVWAGSGGGLFELDTDPTKVFRIAAGGATFELIGTSQRAQSITGGKTLSQADNGAVFDLTAAQSFAVNAGALGTDFRCRFMLPPTGNLSLVFTGTTGNGAGTTITRALAAGQRFVDFQARATANAFDVSGT